MQVDNPCKCWDHVPKRQTSINHWCQCCVFLSSNQAMEISQAGGINAVHGQTGLPHTILKVPYHGDKLCISNHCFRHLCLKINILITLNWNFQIRLTSRWNCGGSFFLNHRVEWLKYGRWNWHNCVRWEHGGRKRFKGTPSQSSVSIDHNYASRDNKQSYW